MRQQVDPTPSAVAKGCLSLLQSWAWWAAFYTWRWCASVDLSVSEVVLTAITLGLLAAIAFRIFFPRSWQDLTFMRIYLSILPIMVFLDLGRIYVGGDTGPWVVVVLGWVVIPGLCAFIGIPIASRWWNHTEEQRKE